MCNIAEDDSKVLSSDSQTFFMRNFDVPKKRLCIGSIIVYYIVEVKIKANGRAIYKLLTSWQQCSVIYFMSYGCYNTVKVQQNGTSGCMSDITHLHVVSRIRLRGLLVIHFCNRNNNECTTIR